MFLLLSALETEDAQIKLCSPYDTGFDRCFFSLIVNFVFALNRIWTNWKLKVSLVHTKISTIEINLNFYGILLWALEALLVKRMNFLSVY